MYDVEEFIEKIKIYWKKLSILAGLLILVSGFFLYLLLKGGNGSSFEGKQTLPQQNFEPEEAKPDIKRELLPDGRTIEYGTRNGPLSPQRKEELRKIIEGKKNQQSLKHKQGIIKGFAFTKSVIADSAVDNPADSLVVDDKTGHPENEARVREMFQKRQIYWTEGELPKLRKIVIVAELMGGKALGSYDYVKIKDKNGNFQDWQGIIWVVSYSSGGITVAHEYGHHFTDYWAAVRSKGSWDKWPATEKGDYYEMRPLPKGCHCETYSCPYYLHTWEILAEDFRHTTSKFNNGHMFVGQPCRGGGTIPWPDKFKTSAYLYSLPLQKLSPTPVPTVVEADITPTISISKLNPSPTTLMTLPTCVVETQNSKTIKLGKGYPCR